ncbi:MAG TPA: ABC transporter substrate-binding protein [Candidatus Binatia bacterium]|jgi:NitT/TauT family transport system substrate-binding protein|nr:ABC transporter substrate-binding protein [Candidatus Binatia bacterium]
MKACKYLVAALLLIALEAAPLHAQKMKVGYWTSGFSLGFGTVLEQMKFGEQEGLQIEWVRFGEVNGPTRAIVSNAIDIAFAAPSTNSIGIAADGVPVKLVLATQIAEAQIVALDGSPIKTPGDLKGKKIGMTPPGSAAHALTTAILERNFGIKPNEYSVAPGNEAQLAQFLAQKNVDASVLRSVTLAQMTDVKLRRLASVVDEWKKLTKGSAPPILAVTIVYNSYLDKNAEAVAKFIVATRNALQFGSKNKPKVAELLEKAANMNAQDARAYAEQWDNAYIASFEDADIASLKRMYDIVPATSGAKNPARDDSFDAGPYKRSKQMK